MCGLERLDDVCDGEAAGWIVLSGVAWHAKAEHSQIP